MVEIMAKLGGCFVQINNGGIQGFYSRGKPWLKVLQFFQLAQCVTDKIVGRSLIIIENAVKTGFCGGD